MIGTENWATQVQKMWKRTRRLGGRLLLAGVLACATMLAAAGATEPETHQPVKCPGEYGGHLQGLDVDGQGFVYWSMTVAIVKTNADGELVCRVDAPSHQGDLTCREGWVYVAVNLGLFNDPEERADSWVYVYDAADLSLLEKHPLGDVVYGAGGIAHDGEHFLVVGGLPDDRQVNHVYEYDEGFRLLAHHEIASGHTHLGIQTATFADGHWWFGCYGRPPQLLKVDRDFQMAGRYTFDASLGVAPLGDGRFLLGRGKCTDGTCQGWAVVGHSDAESGLRLDD
ncbi:MAG: hypothetical protein KDA63_07305 [Planctomycetales bacterium]|nr:hypothetical protein [Planctomycetales bacterium]